MASRRAGGQQLLFAEDTDRTTGRDARQTNITAAKAIAQAVRTTLGPKGMDKMLVDSSGNVVVSNDGVTILSEMDIEHPGANMIVEVAETLEEEVGDGTTSAVVLAGELLKEAEELVDQDIHPSTVADGYRRATVRANELLEDGAIAVARDDSDTLEQIALTSMTGKSVEDAAEPLARIVVEAVRAVAKEGVIDLGDIDVRTVEGQSVAESELVDGVLVDEEPVHTGMPVSVTDATVGILDGGIEVDEPEIDAEIAVDDAQQLREFQDAEQDSLRERAEAVADAGATVIAAGGDIADAAAEYLAAAGILAIEGVDGDVLARLARVTDADRMTTTNDLAPDRLGTASAVDVDELGEEEVVFVEGTTASDVATIILRAGTEDALKEIERAIDDALHSVQVTIEGSGVLGGGGAPETQLALELRNFAEGVGGREQLAIETFADALEVIPRTLAENAGLDPIDSLVDLRARHDGGDDTAGLDPATGDVIDMWDEGTVEPVGVKKQVLGSATEAATMILRIDDVISASS